MGATACIPGAELGGLQCQHRTGARQEGVRSSSFPNEALKGCSRGRILPMAQHDEIAIRTREQMPNRKQEGGEPMRSHRWQQSSGLQRNAKRVDNQAKGNSTFSTYGSTESTSHDMCSLLLVPSLHVELQRSRGAVSQSTPPCVGWNPSS